MGKSLAEMSLEELWQLFPIILREHNPAYGEWYRIEKEGILACLEGCGVARINHIGSSVVPGLISKPTVDILLEVDRECDFTDLKDRLMGAGWGLMLTEEKPYRKMTFQKGYTPEGFAEKVYHLHVRDASDWGELYFRDYLLGHPDVAREYGALKMGLWKRYEHDRDGYTDAKGEFVRKYTEMARAEFGERYLPSEKAQAGLRLLERLVVDR